MEQVEKMSVTVTAAMARDIREKVASGSYASASEVIRAALRALQKDDQEHAERISSIKARIKASVDNPGPGHSSEEVFGRLRARLEAKATGGGFHEEPSNPLE
ncbi:MAG: type II toxin-antitoxin system ParD family antitoxin [Mesorhizobium sp.]|nr:type II toxin-antitoxin system ParD family antitoxin [Mesorhizobium sp.]